MVTVHELVQTARQQHLAGLHTEAERIYRYVLDTHPHHAEVSYLLGVLLHHRGDNGTALDLFRRATALDVQSADYPASAGVACRYLGRLDHSAACHRRAIALDPANVPSFTGLGHTQAALGDTGGAVRAYGRSLVVDPLQQSVRNTLVTLLHSSGRLDEAVEVLRAVAGPDASAETWCNLGVVLKQAGRYDEAIDAYRRAVVRQPDLATALTGISASFLGQFRMELADVWARLALDAAPEDANAHEALARVQEMQGERMAAVSSYRRAIALTPGVGHLYFNMGLMLEHEGKNPGAADAFMRSLRARPGLEQAYEKLPLKLNLCDWRDYDSDRERLINYIENRGGWIAPLPLLYMPVSPELHRISAGRTAAAEVAKRLPGGPRMAFAHPRTPKDRITVGYVSGDFREHAVAFLIAELFELHDRNRFHVRAYCAGPDREGQVMRNRLLAAFDSLTMIRDMEPRDAAERIHADGVDILVDLSGHTRYSRHDVFALRPAPVQVNYLGYPGTVGADFLDYILVDPVVAPFQDQPFYSERLVQLPHCYQANDRQRAMSANMPTRAMYGLPEDAFVFCCFNNTPKFTPFMFDAWMELLRAVPHGVLWLLLPEEAAAGHLRREAAARGVDPARLVFAPRVSPADHLPRFRLADLFLDTAPYNAHTTGSDALWMGLPLVTFLGDTFAGRVGASLLRAAGLPELAAGSLDGYKRIALTLAHNPQILAGLRARLTAGRDTCPLFNAPLFTRHVERAYEQMWRTWLAGEAPRPFAVEPLG